ncbi:MAG: hypothetical protein IIB30_02300 [Chloroflexi bacterium]|nr:hypothetical protein [Chloroflexota bacterium]MCH8224299.1 hypothetical protein [Chloroflexota bacterium]
MELEQRGVPTVTVCTHLFVRLGEVERRALGMPELPMAIAQHPLGGLKTDAVLAKAETLLDQVVAGLTIT